MPIATGVRTDAAAATHGPPTSRPVAHAEMTTIALIRPCSVRRGTFLDENPQRARSAVALADASA